MLKNKNIALYVTGGIAAYKAVLLARLLVKEGATVRVSMTPSACEFVSPLTFQVITKNKVCLDTFDEEKADEVQHIHLADWSDLAIVAPATANTIAKMAHGIADNFVTSALLATTSPIMIAPAMNEHMWQNPATIRNVEQLKRDGRIVLKPAEGFLAEGYSGKGRLPEPELLVEQIKTFLKQPVTDSALKGKKILITAGGTKERIDPVRYISNDSSGKMGYALAKTAAQKGADVLLISTNPTLKVPEGVAVVYVESAREMEKEVLDHFPGQDVVVMVAAVSDYRVKTPATQKVKKNANHDEWTLTLVKNPDILKQLGESKTKTQVVIGFAAETEKVLEYATEKLRNKKVDYIIANDVSSSEIGFNADLHQVTILSKDGGQFPLPKVEKEALADKIWETIIKEEDRF